MLNPFKATISILCVIAFTTNAIAQDNGPILISKEDCAKLQFIKYDAQQDLNETKNRCNAGVYSSTTCHFLAKLYSEIIEEATRLYEVFCHSYSAKDTMQWQTIRDLDTIKEYDALMFALNDMLSPNTFQP